MTTELLGARRTIGDTDAILGRRSAHTARVLVETDLVTLPTQAFLALLAQHPRIAQRWLQRIAQEVNDSRRRISNLISQPVTARAAQLLLDTAVHGTVHVSQETLADVVGARRGTLNRVLRELADQDLIDLAYRQIRIKDRTALKRVARVDQHHDINE